MTIVERELAELLSHMVEDEQASAASIADDLAARSVDATEAADVLLGRAAEVMPSNPTGAARALEVIAELTGRGDRADRLAERTPAADYLRARLAVIEGRPAVALDLIEAARRGWLAAGRPLDALRTDLGRVNVCNDLGRHDEAAATAGRLLEEVDRLTELSADEAAQAGWLRGAALENLGAVQGLTGHFDEALANHRRAEQAYQDFGGPLDVARARANLGVTLVNVGQAVDGLDVLEDAVAVFDEAGDRWSHAKCLGHIADALLLLARYGACLDRCEQARAALDELGAGTERSRVGLRTMRAYLGLNLIEEVEGLAEEIGPELEEQGLVHDLAECRWLRALAQLRLGRSEDAIDLLDRAVSDLDGVDDTPLLVRILVARSEAQLAAGDADGARRSAAEAVELVGRDRWPTEELQALLQLVVAGPGGEAPTHLERAQTLADELRLPHLRYPVLLALGRFEAAAGHLDVARDRFDEAVTVVEGFRGLLTDEALRSSYLAGRTSAHGELITLLLDGGDPADAVEAFDLAERSKARSLADLLAGVVSPSGPLDALTAEQHDLDAAYNTLIAGGQGLPADRRMVVQQRALDLERRVLVDRRRAQAGRQDEIRAVALTSPSRPQAGEHLVEYHIVDDRLFAFVWADGNLEVVEIADRLDAVAQSVERWSRQLGRQQVQRQLDPSLADGLVGSASAVLADLWTLVMAPVAPLLGTSGGPVTIVPHGILHAVPFHAIVGPDGPLLDRWTITVAPSHQVASQLPPTPISLDGQRRSLVVGVPDDAAPLVEGEARAVADLVPGADLLLGDQATDQALRAGLEQPRDVVHLACHGLHRAANPMFSALRLADHWLTATDVLSLRLDGSLVVLSACESGRQGGIGHHDETVGLARSFLAAGASAVVVSLWLAGDRITAELMSGFYQALRAGQGPAEALRRSQLDLSNHHPHPGDWAPFVVHGHP